MDWIHIMAIFAANIGVTISMFLWARKESGADRRMFLELMLAIQNEMKDFHGRLAAIEERAKINIVQNG